jgi:hypothetical protein
MSYAKHLLIKCCERCEEGKFDTCENTLSCPVYALYVEATKKEIVVYKQDGWQVPPAPKEEMI